MKRMSDRIPLRDELSQPLGQLGQVREGGLVQALALQDAEPLQYSKRKSSAEEISHAE